MGKNKKFKSFAEETAEELSAMKATLLKTQEQQGEIFLQFCAADRRSEEFGKKCLKQLSDSANCNLGEFSKALTAHEMSTSENMRDISKRVEDISGRLSGRVNSLEEFQITRLTNRINELEHLVMMGRAKPKKKAAVVTFPEEAPITDFISADNVVMPPPGSGNPLEDPITAELKDLEQFCNDKKKKGDAERTKVLPLPEDVG